MIVFKKVRWKNFLSTGNNFIEVNLDKHHTALIVGDNGAGKSTILDALSFSLFNKPFRAVKKDQLVNSINLGGTEVEVEFQIGSKEYKVCRGIKPNKFEIYVDDDMINQDATIMDYQKHLEQNILKINSKTFNQVVVLGSSSFIPFMQLKNSFRRDVIEEILDIKVFSIMNILAKQKQKELDESIKELKKDIEVTGDKILTQQKYIKEAEKQTQTLISNFEDQIDDNKAHITTYEKQKNELYAKIENKRNSIKDEADTRANLTKLQKFEIQLEDLVNKKRKDRNFYQTNENCPTCKQSIDEEFKNDILEKTNNKLKEVEEGLLVMNKKVISNQKRIDEITSVFEDIRLLDINVAKCQQSIDELKNYTRRIESDIQKLKDKKSNADEAHTMLEKLVEESNDQQQLNTQKIEESDYIQAARVLLQDDGIKTKIIKQYLPIMNQLINKYLASMDFFVNFKLDEEFNEKIRSRFRDEFSYLSFSEGEKMRIDLALLFTWRAVAKMKNSVSTNLLILDEIFDSSLDTTGTDDFLKILNTLKDENVFIISHKTDIMMDKFANQIHFEKHKNFTRIYEPWQIQ
jgi:DNA repair exonuclease SbcCD ATPase subunit